MKVLFVTSGNKETISPFVLEQGNALIKSGIEVSYFKIIGKGITGYLKNLKSLKKKIKELEPDLIHAHYGLSGLLVCLQKQIPVIITFHGSDANIFLVRIFSKIAANLSDFNIFVESKIKARIKGHNKNKILPCGVNLDNFYPIKKSVARKQSNLDSEKKYILFSSAFDNPVKNYQLAKSAISILNEDIILLELKNKTREEVNLLLNACDIALLTSLSEGSPQFIKEAMSCNCPIVATDVGDVKKIISQTEGCFVTSFDPDNVANKIKIALEFRQRTDGRQKIKSFSNSLIAIQIINIYETTLKSKSKSLVT